MDPTALSLSLSIVVPTLDEERSLPELLPPLFAEADEVVVSDGGSRDATGAVAEALGARLVVGPPGRGGQLARGAATARGEALLFVHADTRLPVGAGAAVRAALAGGASGGGFLVRFDAPGLLYRFGERCVNARTRALRVPLGDQAQFVRRDAYTRLGGFRDWPILEDLDFVLRLRRAGRLAIVSSPVTTSARRFVDRGPVRTVVTNWLIWALYFAGVSPSRLARFYRATS